MKEQLITFETAKLAKEKGFDLKTLDYYWTDNKKLGIAGYSVNHNTNELLISSPTQSLLQKWLREIYGVHIVIDKQEDKYYFFFKYKMDRILYKTYEQALEKGLQEALKLIQKTINQ